MHKITKLNFQASNRLKEHICNTFNQPKIIKALLQIRNIKENPVEKQADDLHRQFMKGET